MKFAALLLVVFLAFPCYESLEISVYYEALCPDSVKFITQQLYPGYQVLSPYLRWHLIPYGFAKRHKENGKWNFTCQHGPKECLSNKGQACAFHFAKKKTQIMEYANCVESSGHPGEITTLQSCSTKNQIDWDKIETCLKDGTGDELLVKYGKKTDSVTPKIAFIPAVIFNNSFNATLQNNALKNFLGTACKLLNNEPKACTHQAILGHQATHHNKV